MSIIKSKDRQPSRFSAVITNGVRLSLVPSPPAERDAPRGPRIAIAHDYLTQRGGAERVVLAMARAFPDAVIYTSLYDPKLTFSEFAEHRIETSPVNRIGWLRRHHRAALPIMPLVSRTVSIDADIVLASSSGWAHGFHTDAARVVYCYSPARWLWHRDSYVSGGTSRWVRSALQCLSPALRWWDKRAARGAHRYLAISQVIHTRIREAYDLPSTIVPAPQTMDAAGPTEPIEAIEDWQDEPGYYLCVSRLLPYKNVDAVVDAFTGDAERRLVVVGRGPERDAMVARAPANVRFLTDLSDAQMRTVYAGCRAVVASSYEDYGLTPLEGAVHGRPSVVLRWGGYLDTMVEDVTAVMFDRPDPIAIRAALSRCEDRSWDPDAIRANAERFSEDRFASELQEIITSVWTELKESR